MGKVQAHLPEVDFQARGIAENFAELIKAGRGDVGEASIQPFKLGLHGRLKLLAFVHRNPGIKRVVCAA